MKIYDNSKNVYEALQERLDYIFKEFDYIYVSFSGGKDSGLLLNLVLDYKRSHGYTNKIGVSHQDFEAQYTKTTEYVTRTFENNLDDIEPFWMCLPMQCHTEVSQFVQSWSPWDPDKKDVWCREMPKMDYVINLENNPFDFYKYKMLEEKVYEGFGKWIAKKKGCKVCGLLGIRSQESLNRFRAVNNKVNSYDGNNWMMDYGDDYISAYPLYDWETEDVWIANAKFGYDYNELYDLFYKAGLTIDQMRVASAFNEHSNSTLQIYRIVDPEMWCKLLGRMEGTNFTNIYSGTHATANRRNIKLPEGHTWKSYTEFLLSTLPADIAAGYLDKFTTSIKFWSEKGGAVANEAIAEIEALGYRVRQNGSSPWSKNGKTALIFDDIPDDTDDVTTTIDIPSWKRMCICILRNDHDCRSMGFGPTAEQQRNINIIKEKYKAVAFGGDKNGK